MLRKTSCEKGSHCRDYDNYDGTKSYIDFCLCDTPKTVNFTKQAIYLKLLLTIYILYYIILVYNAKAVRTMRKYQKPELVIEFLRAKEELASVVPTVVDEEYDPETSITNDFGENYWD